MNIIEYDFSSLLESFELLKANKQTPEIMQTIKGELNRFFEDSNCKEVIFTTNTDKMFFGIKIVPMLDADDVYDYIIDDEKLRVDKYIVELDSKLFDPVMDLTPQELLTLLIREVSHLVGSSQPIEDMRNALHIYLAENRTTIKISQSIHYKEILAYGLKDYLSKAQSIFYNGDKTDVIADEFILAYGFISYLETAYDKIFNSNIKLYENCNVSKFIIFSWTLDLYRNIKTRRVGAISTLNELKTLTASRLEKMEMDNVIRRIQRIDDDSVLSEGARMDNLKIKIKEKLKKARLNNLRMIDSTFYELSMQVKNVEDENDALYLMRQINTNLSVVDEYRNSEDCDDYEKERWNAVFEKFMQLRDKLTDTVVYKNKQYGLFVNYPEIVENRY